MRSISTFVWALIAFACAMLLYSCDSAEVTMCDSDACKAWEALEAIYNSTGNITDVGNNRTAGDVGNNAGRSNSTTDRNATIPMPNDTRVPSPTTSKPGTSHADFPFTAKTTAATLVLVIMLLAA